ncbi:MAG: ATP-dependent zinc metalloprotease FtsH [bacterium]|nr:ATP-dependent zinc metalloprotease FtsH [bacterium]
MPDPKPPAPEKGTRPRPFGPFLLFLTVLVVVLIAFGGSQASKTKDLSQDEFLWRLNVGEVATLKTLDQGDVLGKLADGSAFRASFQTVEAIEAELQQLKAAPRPCDISAQRLESILNRSGVPLFLPKEAKHLTTFVSQKPIEESDTRDEGSPGLTNAHPLVEQNDYLLVTGTAAPLRDWGASADNLPTSPSQNGGLMRFRVTDSSVTLEQKLNALGVTTQSQAFNLTLGSGMSHTETDSTLSNILMLWGPWLLILFVFMLFMRQMRSQGGGSGVMSFGRSRATLYNKENDTGVTFGDVAGAQEAKAEVREVVEFLKNPGRFTSIGGRIPRGVMLVGPPGCGKTLLAKAIAGEAEVPFFSISGSDFVEMFVGVGASRVRDLFKQARDTSPCIIFLDEIDAVGRRRGSGMGGGHDEREQTLNAILVEMDGFGTDDGVIVVASTNRPDVLDPALLRPGRFDREVTIDLPDLEGRLAILKVHLKKVKLADDIDHALLAKSTPGYSGADLAAIVNEAAIMAVLADCDTIHMEHLEEATTKVRYGRKKTSMKLDPDELRDTAYHESGHTIVAAKIDAVDPPHKVTIVPRGRSLGSTMMLPERESYSYGRNKMLGQLAMAFGGRVAEELFCKDISAGASDDINHATRIARSMVSELGMSERVGPINYAERQGSDFLGTEVMSDKRHSEETARIIDEEIERILREGYAKAQSIIEENRDAVERLTEGLLMYETLDRLEIDKLIEGADPESLRPDPPEEEPTPPAQEDTADAESPASGEADLPGFSGEAGLSPA